MTTQAPSPERLAYSIVEFCKAVGISRSFFYNLPDDQKPRMKRVGYRVLISADAAREWLEARS